MSSDVTIMNTDPGGIWKAAVMVYFVVGLPYSICLEGLRVIRTSFCQHSRYSA
jgi:hypothetical protein